MTLKTRLFVEKDINHMDDLLDLYKEFGIQQQKKSWPVV